MPQSFADRHGYRVDAEITVRQSAPKELRRAIPVIAHNVGMGLDDIRRVMCKVLVVLRNPNNVFDSEVWPEIEEHFRKCSWIKVYEIAEALYRDFTIDSEAKEFANYLNQHFRENGIGWEMRYGEIEYRGSEAFAGTTREAVSVLEESGLPNAASEMREALKDISRRPNPDRTGAIQHVAGAMEAVGRAVTGRPNDTFGQLLPDLDLPKPLDTAVDKLWGYASEYARHVKEGRTVGTEEAELLVSVACALCTFLTKRNPHPSEH